MMKDSAVRTAWWTGLLVVAIVVLGCLPRSNSAGASESTPTLTTYSVGRPRPPRVGESAFEDTLPLLAEPENSNHVPGPSGLVALMKADARHHPRLYLRRPSSADSMSLLIDRYATKPLWAPVGERIACTVWKSRALPWSLCILTVGKPDTLYPIPDANVVRYRWSPDARHLAVSATLPGGAASILYLIDTRTGSSRALDTLAVYSDYEMGWSPDSRLLAVSRPTRLADMEEVLESEIWIHDLSGHRLLAVPAEGHANITPRWVDTDRVLFTRATAARGAQEALVVELKRSTK